MFDIVSYILGKKQGNTTVIVQSDRYVYTDDGEGNITVTEVDDGE